MIWGDRDPRVMADIEQQSIKVEVDWWYLHVSNAKSLRERETIWIEDCVPCIVVGGKFIQMRI